MSELVTIKTFTFPHEVAIVRSRLEAEGVYCFVQDELNPFSYIADGGIKQLQVPKEDAERAIALLKESGDLSENDLRPSQFQVKLYRFLSKIPLLRRMYK